SAFAKEFDVTLLLKGATTVIAGKDGRVALVCVGSPGMAKGGSGDVLTGVIAGFAAQGKQAFESALLGAYIAASAGEIAAEELGEYSMTPADTVDYLGDALQEVTSDRVLSDVTIAKVIEEIVEPQIELEEEQVVVGVDQQIEMQEKTAEVALAEIEEKEKTQEIKKDILDEIKNNGDKPEGTDPTTRRRIG
ncbi:NAD(P)H-hydrate dehydratase, partial [Christensenellaceae bacterium OttesenSCG-928-K19]|nr:NAD(P)H-hydrate dehydratase [Christensenellaceae bacterium OttesenSCG-928-K19]